MTSRGILLLLSSCALVGGMIFGGYKWGYQEGHQRATDQVIMGTNITNCVFLAVASRKELSGDQVAARDLRNRLLFESAMELNELIDSGRLNEEESRDARGVVRDVARHYWAHPNECSLTSREQTFDHLKTKIIAFLQEYKDAEQVAAPTP